MNTTLFKSITLLAALTFCHLSARSPSTVLPCTIEFPKSIKVIPQICVYQSGERFSCELDKAGKRVCFTLPVDKLCTNFSLLITEKFQYESEQNTIQYLKVDTTQAYKFYALELVRAPRKRYRLPSEKNKIEKKIKDRWIVSKKELETNGRIPDDAIIVLLDSEFVDTLKADNTFEFPTIVIRSDVLAIAGSETKLQDKAIELLLSSMDYSPLHSNFKFDTKQDKQNIIVAIASI